MNKKETSFSVRKVRGDDYAAWSELWAGYNAFYGRSGETALPPEIVNNTWARFLDPEDSMTALVAEEGANLLGLAHILFHASTISIQPVCYLRDLFTAPDQRGRGVGESLLTAAASEAQARGARKLYWHTQDNNTVARRLYDRVAQHRGFILYDWNL